MNGFMERIREAYPALSTSFTRLADFVLESYPQVAFLTASELAQELDVDPATVVRFAQRLGYTGYPDLQREIRERVRREVLDQRYVEPDSPAGAADQALARVSRSLDLTRRSFSFETAEALVAALDEARRVVLLAEGLAVPPARSLAAALETAGATVHRAGGSPSELALALAGARKGDLAIAMEIADEAPFLGRALEEARRLGLRTAALVASPAAPSARHADLVLAAHASPEPGIGQILVEALVYALVQMLMYARPGRYGEAASRVEALKQRLALPGAD